MPHRCRSALVLFLLLPAFPCITSAQTPSGWPSLGGSSGATPAPATLSLGDGTVGLVIAQSPVGHCFERLTRVGLQDLLFEPEALFRVTVVSGGVETVLRPADFAVVQTITSGGARYLRWRDSPLGSIVTVTVRFVVTNGGFDADIWVDNRTNGYLLKDVVFPAFRVTPVNPAVFGDAIVLPVYGGAVTVESRTLPEFRYPSPGSSMQMVTIFDRLSPRAFYWQTKDGFGSRKDVRVLGVGTATSFDVTQHPTNNHLNGTDYVSTFSFSMTLLAGDWYDAALRYRAWAHAQPWMVRGRLETSPIVSERVKALKLHALQYPDHSVGFDAFPSLVADAERVKNHLGLAPGEMMCLWSDWSGPVFNTVLPDFLPVRSTVASGLAAATAAGIGIIPYIHLNLWSPSSLNYATFAMGDYAVRNFDQSVLTVFAGPSVNELFYPHVVPNPAHAAVRTADNAIVQSVLGSVPSPSFAAVYLDTWSGVSPELDYNPRLPTKGGGPAWTTAKMIEGAQFLLTTKASDRDRAVTSEAPVENIIPVVELMHYNPIAPGTLQLPVWETVYHGYALCSSLDATVPQLPDPIVVAAILPAISYDFHLGKILGISNFFANTLPFIHPDPLQNQGIVLFDYLRELIRVDRYATKYRLFGEALRPPSTSFPHWLVSLEFLFLPPPEATGSLWRASDGEVGILLTNTGAGVNVLNLAVSFADYGLSGTYTLYANLDGVRLPLGQFAASFTFPVPLLPRSALLLELVPTGP